MVESITLPFYLRALYLYSDDCHLPLKFIILLFTFHALWSSMYIFSDHAVSYTDLYLHASATYMHLKNISRYFIIYVQLNN